MSNKNRIVILLNPAAGKGKAFRAKSRLERSLRQLGIPFDLYVTQNEKHLRTLTFELAGEYQTLVGAGGDSTFQIMVNEMMKHEKRPSFGLIGLGSSNDVTREFGVDSVEKACLALKRGRLRTIDVGYVWIANQAPVYFLGQVNIGLGVAVNQLLESFSAGGSWFAKRQNLSGFLAVLEAYRKKYVPLHLEVESATESIKADFVAAIFSNIRYWATGRLINPGARVDDGNLDACLIQSCPLHRLARLSRLARKGHHGRSGEVSFLHSPVFKIRATQAFAIQADGEILGGWISPALLTSIQVRILPHALNLIC